MASRNGTASPSRDWSLVLEALSARLSQQHWLGEEAWKRAKEDAPEGLACVVLDLDRHDEVVLASRALEAAVGLRREAATGRSGLSFLRASPGELDEALNGAAWRRLRALHGEVLQCSSAACDPEALVAQPTPAVVPVLSPRVGGGPCWQLLDAIPLLLPAESSFLRDRGAPAPPADGSGTALRHFVAYILTPLEAPVPTALWAGDSRLGLQNIAAVASGVHDAVDAQREQGRTVAEVVQTAEKACKDLAGSLQEAGEGDHFVPQLGYESVTAFERLRRWEVLAGCMETELRTAWEANDEVYRSFADGEAKAVACSVADPAGIDCPLIYISPGFEDLTGYRRTWALGRNCRFLQPNNRRKNLELNGDELRRMRTFCTENTQGNILNILYNEAANGMPFWNVLFMQHVYLPEDVQSPTVQERSGGRKNGARHYIFGVQTNITGGHKLALDQLVFRQQSGGEALHRLRGMFSQKESSFCPSGQSLLRLCEETIADWIQREGREVDSNWEGGLYVPKVGERAIGEFAGRWPTLVKVAAGSLRKIFGMRDRVLAGMKDNAEESQVVCAVSDPSLPDCPLVFLSKAFERMTGYDCSFGLGRNCRFLQPNTAGLNKTINGKELERMRAFCKLRNATGTAITNLLLNEHRGGERFWNLLHMTHVEVDGKAYIVGVQTILELPMPQLIKCRDSSDAMAASDKNALDTFATRLGLFLDQLRGQLQDIDDVGVVETIKQASIAILAFARPFCDDDYEGDHFVPAVGRRQAADFECDGVWSSILEQMKARWPKTLGPTKDLKNAICTVADPSVVDFPLVHISRTFEEVTKYSKAFALGRSCRFLQPKSGERNTILNGKECRRVGDFCAAGKQGEHLMSLMVNEDADGEPFYNLLILEHIMALGRPYILGVQTTITCQIGRLAELLAMDADGLKQLTKLQQIVRDFKRSSADMGIHDIASACVSKWAAQAPAFFQLPLMGPVCAATASAMPCASLQLTPKTDMSPVFTRSLENGIRHFHLAFTDEDLIGDKRIVGLSGKLFTLRIAELLMSVQKQHLHHLRAGVAFTLVTPPALIDAFAGIARNLVVCRSTLDCWMLDVRDATLAQVSHCWQEMLRALHAKEAPALGLWGVSRAHFDIVSALPEIDKLSVVAIKAYASSDAESTGQRIVEFFRGLRGVRHPITVQAYGVYGPRQSLLRSTEVAEEAKDRGTSASVLALKWSESRGFVAVVPTLGLERPPATRRLSAAEDAASAVPLPQLQRPATVTDACGTEGRKPAGAAAEQEDCVLRAFTDTMVSAKAPAKQDCVRRTFTDTKVSAKAPVQQDADRQPGAEALNMHRRFVRMYHEAPSASLCATALEHAVHRASRSEGPQSPVSRRTSSLMLSPRAASMASTCEGGLSDSAGGLLSPRGSVTRSASGKTDPLVECQELMPSPPKKGLKQGVGPRPARRHLVAHSSTLKGQDSPTQARRRATISSLTPESRRGLELSDPGPAVLQSVSVKSTSPMPSPSTDGMRRASTNSACVRLRGWPPPQSTPSMTSCSTSASPEVQPSNADVLLRNAMGKLRARGWSDEDLAELFEVPFGQPDALLSSSSGSLSGDGAAQEGLAGG